MNERAGNIKYLSYNNNNNTKNPADSSENEDY